MSPPTPAGTISVIIEVPTGGGVRHRYFSIGAGYTEPFVGSGSIPALDFVAYGAVPGTHNDADGCPLDVYLLGAEGLGPTDPVAAKVLGARIRNDGDHKILAVRADHAFARFSEVDELPPELVDALGRWHEAEQRPEEHWISSREAVDLIDKMTLAAVGGKAAGLSLLQSVASVPRFVALPTTVFETFLTTTGIGAVLESYWEVALRAPVSGELDAVRRSLVHAIFSAPFDVGVAAAIEGAWSTLCSTNVVVRSSAVVEDGTTASWAGQFHTLFGVGNCEDCHQAIRECWAAVATKSAARYAVMSGQQQRPRIAVVLQEAVEPVASGVVFAVEWDVGGSVEAVLEVTLGLGSPLVRGLVAPERWEYAGDTGIGKLSELSGGPIWLIAPVGDRRLARRVDEGDDVPPGLSITLETPGTPVIEVRTTGRVPARGIVEATPVGSLGRSQPILTEAVASDIAMLAIERSRTRNIGLELEWAIDADGNVQWLQERPVTAALPHGTPQLLECGDVLVRGVPASGGRVRGPGWWHFEPHPLDQEPAILFKSFTTPADVGMLLEAGGLVTQEGGILSHAAIISRELGLPCIVGARPFPPHVGVERTLELDASAGEVRPGQGARGERCPKAPPPLLASPAANPRTGDVRLWLGDSFAVPSRVLVRLDEIASLPGVLDGVDALPDLRMPEPGLGFPVGTVFRSERLHPTAVGDCGDGFRLSLLEGVDAQHLRRHAGDILQALRHHLGADSPAGAAVLGAVSVARAFAEGLQCLDGTEWQEPRQDAVEAAGRLVGGLSVALSPSLRDLAQRCLTWHGESGHFLELLSRPDGSAVVLLHTGSAELGLACLRNAVEIGTAAAALEGMDDPAHVRRGLWGLEVTTSPGRELAAMYVGLVNYGFARRSILERLVEQALSDALSGQVCVRAVSDVVHTAVRPDGDALLHQQGVQSLRALGARTPLVLAGAPLVRSYELQPRIDSPVSWCAHGKVELTVAGTDAFRDEAVAHAIATGVWLHGGGNAEDLAGADARARQAVAVIASAGIADPVRPLTPIICLRGSRNRSPKLPSLEEGDARWEE